MTVSKIIIEFIHPGQTSRSSQLDWSRAFRANSSNEWEENAENWRWFELFRMERTYSTYDRFSDVFNDFDAKKSFLGSKMYLTNLAHWWDVKTSINYSE